MKIIVLSMILLFAGGAAAQTDTTLYRYAEAKQFVDKSIVRKISLSDIVTKQKSIPKEIRNFKNLDYLSLRPPIKIFARPRDGGPCFIGYAQSKTTSLPSWIGDLKHLKEIDLIGINKIDYAKELNKLAGLTELASLSIDPDNFNNALIDVLIRFKSLKSLHIRTDVTAAQLTELKASLPDCKIVTGVYADYK